ncbi:MAG TPA: putative 2OG-Fe(II) oxygenase [Allosphingosinicella sp.]|nr:putative 2OG-Fe(II) oxygenase [Allosphingosinicella sp.]
MTRLDPADGDAAYQAGMAALGTGGEAEALQWLEAARVFHPGDARLWHVSGLLHRALDDLAAALPSCARAASLAPRDFGIAHLHARVTLDAGLPAVALYERVLGIARRDIPQLGLIEAIRAEQGPAAAIERLDAVLAADPGWLEGHAYLARLRFLAGEPERVTASFERALAARPRDVYLWRELVITLIRAVRFEDALAAIARGRAAAGPHPIFDANEALCVDELGDHARAERLFAPLAHVDEVDLIVRRARNALRRGRPQEAASLLEPKLAEEAPFITPYLSAAWRLCDDARWQWLEGDERLAAVYDLEVPEGLADHLRTLHTSIAEPLDQSVRSGTQTEGHLLPRIEPVIQDFRRLLAAAVARHIAQLPAVDPQHPTLGKRRDAPVRFAGSWSVRLTDAGHHADHFHPEGWLSSAFYLAVPEMARGQEGWLKLGEPPSELGLDLPPTRLIEPRPGRLVLFPSTMWHGTIPFAAGERLSVAFDVATPV